MNTELIATVVSRGFPDNTLIDARFIEHAYYKDSYCIVLQDESSNPIKLFHAVFSHRPTWINLVMVTRNWIARRVGLEASSACEIMTPKISDRYEVGAKIGAWPIYAITTSEIVVGRDNSHLDFRLSVLRDTGSTGSSAVFSTVCVVHNVFGKVYLWFVLPFHRWGIRRLIGSAASAGRF